MKRSPECGELAHLWKILPDSPAAARSTTFSPCEKQVYGAGKIFVDIGADIGSCTMQMLARPDVPEVVAFEPDPKNSFYLTGSVLRNPGFKERLALFPMALGQAQNDKPSTTTLDEVFLANGEAPYIHLLKMNAHGFEVSILKGGSKLLSSGAINAIHFKLAPTWLLSAGASPAELFTTLVLHGYDCYRSNGDASENTSLPPVLTHEDLEHISCLENDDAPRDFVAVHNPTKVYEGARFQEIRCPDVK